MVATGEMIPGLSQLGRGEVYVLIAAFCGAWFVLGRQMLSDRLTDIEVTIMIMAIATLTTFILAQVSGEVLDWSSLTSPWLMVALVIGGGFNLLSNMIEVYAYKRLEAVLATQILLTENIFSLIMGYGLYGEVVGVIELVGAGIIVASVYMMNRMVGRE